MPLFASAAFRLRHQADASRLPSDYLFDATSLTRFHADTTIGLTLCARRDVAPGAATAAMRTHIRTVHAGSRPSRPRRYGKRQKTMPKWRGAAGDIQFAREPTRRCAIFLSQRHSRPDTAFRCPLDILSLPIMPFISVAATATQRLFVARRCARQW